MQTKLTQGNKSNYEIILTCEADDLAHAEKHALEHFQKETDASWFRKWYVPLDVVKEKVNPEYLQMAIYEHLINDGLKSILNENKDLKFIGQPYDINPEQKEDKVTLGLKLDIYPEVEVKNQKREKVTVKKIDATPTAEEKENAMNQLKKNYADYKDTDKIAQDTVSKISLQYLDKDGKELHKSSTFVGEPEFTADPFWAKTFLDKKKDEEVEIKYIEGLPQQLQFTKEGKSTTIKATPIEVKQIILPKFDEELLKKLFGPESEVKNEKDLSKFIDKTLAEQKEEGELVKAVENYIQDVMKESMDVTIPHTMIEQENKVRVENLHQRFGGSKEKMKQYFDQMGEEKTKAFLADIKKSAGESLKKFFVLRHICDTLGLEINREKPEKLEIEQKLYNKFNK